MSVSVFAIDGGDLKVGNGLLAILRPALIISENGAIVHLISSQRSNREDLARWCSNRKTRIPWI